MTEESTNRKAYFDKEYCLRIRGEFACFTRPEMKVERVSYDVITPSAARAIFQAVFWKPAIQWQITKIEVLSPIKHISIKRNEVAKIMSPKSDGFFIGEERTQKSGYILRDVDYRIYAKMVYIPVEKRDKESQRIYQEEYDDAQRASENPGKYNGMFERRAKNGQCFTMPYLGTREFTCSFELVENPDGALPAPIKETRDLGYMLYDMDFEQNRDVPPAMFYRAQMTDGIILVPEKGSEEVLR